MKPIDTPALMELKCANCSRYRCSKEGGVYCRRGVTGVAAERPACPEFIFSKEMTEKRLQHWREFVNGFGTADKLDMLRNPFSQPEPNHFETAVDHMLEELSWSEGNLKEWYQDSVDRTVEPVWTDKHIEEVCKDFYLVPRPRRDNGEEKENS